MLSSRKRVHRCCFAHRFVFPFARAKGNTPKYGLIFHSSFIGKASSKNKGRISRYLANKCSIASRLDCFTETPTDKFGVKLREQVEERLAFYEGGSVPRKNVDVMREVGFFSLFCWCLFGCFDFFLFVQVLQEVQKDLGKQGVEVVVEKRAMEDAPPAPVQEKKQKSEKKDKKDKKKSKKESKKEKKKSSKKDKKE